MVSRAQHRRATLTALAEAATDLFEDHGGGVTVEAIASRAGVSRRTVFRYVDSKEELAFVHPIIWFDVFDEALAASDPAEPLANRLRVASEAIAAHIDADPEPPRRAFIVAAANPELHQGFSAVFGRWVDRIAAEVERPDPDRHDAGGGPFRARIIGSAVMGMVDAVTREWVVSPPSVRYLDVYRRGYAIVAPLLDDAGGRGHDSVA